MSAASASSSSNVAVGAPLAPHPIKYEQIAEQVLAPNTIGLPINYDQLVIQLAALLTSPQKERLKFISNTLSDAMTTLVKQSSYKLIQSKHRTKDYFKKHITKAFPIFFDKLQEELATKSPGYTDLLRTIFPKWIKSDDARTILEYQDPTYQCNVTRGEWFKKFNDPTDSIQKKRGCWICGHTLHLWKGGLPGPQCEHKSPVLLAMLHYRLVQVPLKLYDITYPTAEHTSLGEVVLEWSCVLCNMVKNALNLTLEDKVDGKYIVNETNVDTLREEIKNKLGKVNLGKTKALQANPANRAPVWDGNSLFLTDANYRAAIGVDDVKEEVVAPGISEQIRTMELDKTFTIRDEIIENVKTQFDNNKPSVIKALEELTNVSNSAIGLIKSNIKSTGRNITQYQSYEIYTLLTSVRLLSNIHENRLIHFMIEAIDNPDQKPTLKTHVPVPKSYKTKKMAIPSPTSSSKKRKQGGGIVNSLNNKGISVEFIINHFETLIIANIIKRVGNNWAIFSDYVDLCILEDNEYATEIRASGGTVDVFEKIGYSDALELVDITDNSFISITENGLQQIEEGNIQGLVETRFRNNFGIFRDALKHSIVEIHDILNMNFKKIYTNYDKWYKQWNNRDILSEGELDELIMEDNRKATISYGILKRSEDSERKLAEKTRHERELFHKAIQQTRISHNSPHVHPIGMNRNSPVKQLANEISRNAENFRLHENDVDDEPDEFVFEQNVNNGRARPADSNSQFSQSTFGSPRSPNVFSRFSSRFSPASSLASSPASSISGQYGSSPLIMPTSRLQFSASASARSPTPLPLNLSPIMETVNENSAASSFTWRRPGGGKRSTRRNNKRSAKNKQNKRNKRNTHKKNKRHTRRHK